jgi:hypothetical protein
MSRPLSAAVVLALSAMACESPTTTEQLVEPQFASNGTPIDASKNAIDLAVIGDVPYGAGAANLFPTLIESINRDASVRRAVHVGDTKSGSTVCSDEWFHFIYDSFESFKDPLVYTPGDNEWTDCHRNNNGNWNPVERLARIREIFFSNPGQTLGGRSKATDAQHGYPENVMWMESGVVFAAIHLVGSNNNLAPWTCYLPFDTACPNGDAPETPAMASIREAEWQGREAANRAWLEKAFDLADQRKASGVVIFSHGDMWHPEDVLDPDVSFSGHQLFVERLAARSAAFEKPVILFAGDSHDFRVDHPLVGDALYGAPDAPNLTQITVDRSIEDDIVWLKLHVDPRSEEVFSWEEVTVQ